MAGLWVLHEVLLALFYRDLPNYEDTTTGPEVASDADTKQHTQKNGQAIAINDSPGSDYQQPSFWKLVYEGMHSFLIDTIRMATSDIISPLKFGRSCRFRFVQGRGYYMFVCEFFFNVYSIWSGDAGYTTHIPIFSLERVQQQHIFLRFRWSSK